MDAANVPILARRSISEDVYEILKDGILRRRFAPGERLDLGGIERQMGVSRTPLKIALNRLSVEGLVEVRPRKGTFVATLDPIEIAEDFDVRWLLEVGCVEAAVQRLDEAQAERVRRTLEALRRLNQSEAWDRTYEEYIALDHTLHKLILQLTGNRRLLELWEQVNVHVQMARVRYRAGKAELDLTQEEHEAIVVALLARDLAALRLATARHIERAKQSLLAELGAPVV